MAECDDRARRLSEWCTIASNESVGGWTKTFSGGATRAQGAVAV
jgi:hypothetical protein